jgi:hypothetical protein
MQETASVAESDILNPLKGWWDDLGDNPNWNYGWTRKSSANKQLARPRLGRRYSREVLNAGYTMSLNWVDRPWATVLRLKTFYEQFQGGYFTIIDRDGNHRHHVGNFTSEPNAVETANGKYTVQGLIFEEVPQARMLEYPNDFVSSSHWIYALDDYLCPTVASQGTWNAALTPAMAGTSKAAPSSFEWINPFPVAGDFAQIEYVGWGFQMTLRTDTLLGLCDIYVDDVLFQQSMDLSTGTAPQVFVNGVMTPPVVGGFVQSLAMPLDKHRVKIVARAAKGALSTTMGVIFPAIQVMH